MANKPTAKKPAKPSRAAKPAGKPAPVRPSKPSPALKPKSASQRPVTAKVAKTSTSRPPTTTVPRPTTAKVSRSAVAKTDRPTTVKVSKTALHALRRERPGRHEKPGTGRIDRAVSAERLQPEQQNGHGPSRRVAAPVDVPATNLACPFGKDELVAWRRVLLDHRAEISQDIQHLERDAMEAEDGHTTPNHLAERGSDAEMQDMSLGLAGEEQVVLWQIDRALRKIDTGTPLPFGVCEHSKQPIPKTRLQLIPWTPVSIEGMNYVEEHGLTLEDVLIDG